MNQKYTKDIVEYAYHGIDENIPADRTTEVNLRDLMKVQATLAELMQFFHQPLHMQTREDVVEYMGSVDTQGAFKLLHLANYELMPSMLPSEINKLFDEEVFDAPMRPYYFRNNG